MYKKLLFAFIGIILMNNSIAQVPTAGMIAYYPFNNNSRDSTGVYDMTNNYVTYTTDRFGKAKHAAFFNGTSAFLSKTTAFPNDTISYSVWLKPKNLPSIGIILANGSTGLNGLAIILGGYSSHTSGDKLYFYFGNVDNCDSTYTLTDTSKWVHIVVIYKTGSYQLYINNVLKETGTKTMLAPSGPFLIGASYLGSSSYHEYFSGAIDDIRVYNRTLTASEVDKLYNEMPLTVANTLNYNTCRIYPNPVLNNLYIEFENGGSNILHTIKLTNIIGQEVINIKTSENKLTLTPKDKNLTGIYFLSVYDALNTLIEIRKIIIE